MTSLCTARDIASSCCVDRHHIHTPIVSRPTLLTLPYPLLVAIFVLGQNPGFLRCCRLFRALAKDPHVRAQYLQHKFCRDDRLQSSFFVQMLKHVPPVANTRLWAVFKNRKVRKDQGAWIVTLTLLSRHMCSEFIVVIFPYFMQLLRLFDVQLLYLICNLLRLFDGIATLDLETATRSSVRSRRLPDHADQREGSLSAGGILAEWPSVRQACIAGMDARMLR